MELAFYQWRLILDAVQRGNVSVILHTSYLTINSQANLINWLCKSVICRSIFDQDLFKKCKILSKQIILVHNKKFQSCFRRDVVFPKKSHWQIFVRLLDTLRRFWSHLLNLIIGHAEPLERLHESCINFSLPRKIAISNVCPLCVPWSSPERRTGIIQFRKIECFHGLEVDG